MRISSFVPASSSQFRFQRRESRSWRHVTPISNFDPPRSFRSRSWSQGVHESGGIMKPLTDARNRVESFLNFLGSHGETGDRQYRRLVLGVECDAKLVVVEIGNLMRKFEFLLEEMA